MIKTTKFYIVVFLTLVLARTPGFAQYNGGSGDGNHSSLLTLTSCPVPSTFYAYFGGSGDGANTNLNTNTACSTPPSQFFAYMGGNADGAAVKLHTLTSCSAPPTNYFAFMGGTNDGAAKAQLTLTTCGIPSQFYAYMGGAGDGFKADSIINCPTVPPVANFSASTTPICAGSSVTFTDLSTNVPSSWSWTFAGGTPGTSSVQNPTITYNTPGTYNVTLTATNAHGTNTLTMTGYITVNAIPAANAGPNVSICNGSSTTLNASGGTSYSWLPISGLSSATVANPVASPASTTTYTVTATSGGCSSTDAVLVTVNSVPTANAGTDATICNGASTVLTATGGTSYSWSPTTGLSSTTTASTTASPSITTTYTVTVTASGCSATDAVMVTVNPTPTANAGTDVTICNGTSTTLSASGGTSYSWTPAAGLSSTTINNPVASPSSTTSYTVTVTSGSCSSTDAVLVTVTPLPSANAGSDVSVCSGASTTLSASGGTSYSWSPATGLSSTTISNPVASPAGTTTYTVTVTNAGCSATDAVVVTVNSSLTANAGSDVSICSGSSASLNASGGASYSWSPSTGLSSSTVANPVAGPSVTTTYTVTVTSGSCSATDAVVVTVNALPTATISASGPTTFCPGDSVILTASTGASYLWSTTATSSAITVSSSGNYYVTVTDLNGCSATSAVVSVTVHPSFTATINPGGPTTFCQGGSVSLTASSGSDYLWSNGDTTQITTAAVSGTYSVTVSDIYGCAASAASITVTVNPNPPAPGISAGGNTNICIGDTVTLTSSPANSYLWSTGATSDSINVSTAGTYSVIAYNAFGCGTSSSGTTVNVDVPLADFSGSPLLVFTPTATVNFTSTTSGVPPYTYSWNFGDAGTSGLSTPNHTYGFIGYQTVSLTVTDSAGCSNTVTKPSYVEVEQLFPSWAMLTGTTLDLTGVSFIDAQTGIMSMTDGNCLISIDSGNTWSPLPTGNTEALTGTCIIPGNWFVTGVNGTILLSTNNGSSWTPFVTGTTETFNGSSFSSPTNGFAVGTNGTIQKYDGSSWTPESSGSPEHLNNVFALSSGEAIAVGDNQTILKYNGSSWSPQTSPLSFNIKDVRFSSLLNGYAAGTNGIILQTNDGGSTWNPSLTGVDIDFNSIEVAGPDSAWAAGTNGIVYTTVDSGSTWIRYSVGYPEDQDEIRVNQGKGHVTGQGGHGRNFGEHSAIATNITIENPASEFNVYPNPALDKFIIEVQVPDSDNLTIEIRDVNGQNLKTIVSSAISGKFSSEVSTENLSSGIYFIHFSQEKKSWVRKLIIVK
jgi:PKD repeat protein